VNAQVVEVSLSPVSPPPREIASYQPLTLPIGAFRFVATGSAVQVDGIVLTAEGNDNLPADLEANTGIQVWLDDASGTFDSVLDVFLGSVSATLPTSILMFTPALMIAAGSSVDLWIVIAVKGGSGGTVADVRTFAFSIATASDVISSGSTAVLTSPAPVSAVLTLVPPKCTGDCSMMVCAVVVDHGGMTWLLILSLPLAVWLLGNAATRRTRSARNCCAANCLAGRSRRTALR
jgi:hypothetical protein